MATAMGTVTINAAFLLEIKEDNQELRQLLEHAVDALCKPDRIFTPPKKLAELLGQLRDQLAMHFTLEEAFGYFEDAVAVAPRLGRQADTLRGEHKDLFLELCNIVEYAERLQYGESPASAVSRIGDRFSVFHRRFRNHEDRENQLILESLNDDLGVGD